VQTPVAKYLGDGVMAYFGWPEAHDNDAARSASRHALRMVLMGERAAEQRDAVAGRTRL